MAKICYPDHIKHIHGVINKKEKGIVYKYRADVNCLYVSKYTEPKNNPTADDVALRAKFSTAATQVKTIFADPTSLEPYRQAFAKQSKYPTLRGYVFSQVYRTL